VNNRSGVLCNGFFSTLLGRETSCSQWEGPSVHSRCLAFLPLKFLRRGGVGKDFFPIFPGSQCVPTMFLLSSPSRMIGFLKQIQSHINTNKHLRSHTWHEALLNLKFYIYEGFDIRLLSKKTWLQRKEKKVDQSTMNGKPKKWVFN
jgi:hypothetical protein